MRDQTERIWHTQNRHEGDRVGLFRAVRGFTGPAKVLYPGSYVDVAVSAAFDDVTYVDMDRRAARFFDDRDGVSEIVGDLGGAEEATVQFIHADYRERLDLAEGAFDLLVSLYAGLVSKTCTEYLRTGGLLLVNPSHGDAALASIDDRFRLSAAILSRGDGYRVTTENLAQYLVPKQPITLSPELIESRGRGVAYTRPAFAYLFERLS